MTDTVNPRTLIEAVRYYSDLKVCFETMIRVKWPNGKPVCPKCGHDQTYIIPTRHLLQCKAKECRKQFSVKVGTIFEDSPLGLDKWFVATWYIANCKNGISSLELGRALGVTQKTAWFMLHRIREAMKTRSARKFRGEIEGDESFFGGKAANMHKGRRERLIRGRGSVGKAIVQGLLERNESGPSQFRGFVVPNTDEWTLCPNVHENVEKGSHVYTDSAPGYLSLALRYWHASVDHMTGYVKARVHTNGLENFWSLLKRMIHGSYVAVASFHLERYVDEEAWRFNNRDVGDGLRFQRVLRSVVGKRLTYRTLTCQGDAGFMGIH